MLSEVPEQHPLARKFLKERRELPESKRMGYKQAVAAEAAAKAAAKAAAASSSDSYTYTDDEEE